MSRNIRLTSAKAVRRMTTSSRSNLTGASGSGMPAIIDPMVISTAPAITALMVPERLKPAISSSLVMGVTR
jgi:hypothetical protein